MNNPNTTKLIREIFRNFNQEEVYYFVPRNYENYPQDTGKDIDVFIADYSTSAAFRIIKEAANQAGYHAVLSKDKISESHIRLKNLKTRALLIIDVHTFASFDLSGWNHILKGFNQKVWAESIQRKFIQRNQMDFYIPHPTEEILLLLKQWKFKRHKGVYLRKAKLLSEQAEFTADCESISADYKHKITAWFENANADNMYTVFKPLFQLKFGRFSVFKALGINAKLLPVFLKGKFKLSPIIYFSGPDGAGKTTLIGLLAQDLESLSVNFRTYYSLKIYIRKFTAKLSWIKKAARFKKRTASTQGPADSAPEKAVTQASRDRDDGSKFWKVRKYIALLVGILDLWVGYASTIYHRLKGQTVIIETSAHDIFIKYHMPAFPRTEKIIAPFIPLPSRGFLLKASPGAIHARKAELSIEELQEYYGRITSVIKNGNARKSFADIRTDGRLPDTRNRILNFVLAEL